MHTVQNHRTVNTAGHSNAISEAIPRGGMARLGAKSPSQHAFVILTEQILHRMWNQSLSGLLMAC